MGARQKSKEKAYDMMKAQKKMTDIAGRVVIIINVNELTVPGKRLSDKQHTHTHANDSACVLFMKDMLKDNGMEK